MIYPRIPQTFLFGPGKNTYSTLEVNSGVVSFVSTVWCGLNDSKVNSVAVTPFIDGSGTYAFTGALVLRLTLQKGVSTLGNDVILYVPTIGCEIIIPLFSNVFECALYAVSADQTLNASVVFS
jgi:hypothetical protein